jgi:SAM-dependent methyltransferase
VHELAAGFADAAAAYDRGRPRYPGSVLEAILEGLGAVAGDRVLDLAAGTGLLARPLLDAGLDVVAVEPLDGMRAALQRAIGAERVLAGRAEALPLTDASVAGVVCGDAWHWFDAPRAASELYRVARPGAAVVVSYLGPHARDAWWADVGAILEPLRHAARHPRLTQGRRPGALEVAGFGALDCREVDFVHATDRDGLLAYFASISFVGALSPGRRNGVLTALAAVLDRHGVGSVDIPYRAELWTTRRR